LVHEIDYAVSKDLQDRRHAAFFVSEWAMQRKTCQLLFLVSLALAANAQSPTDSFDATPPPDLHYVLRLTDGRTQFHLGEAIEIEELYSSDISGKYFKDGRPTAFTFQPDADVVDRSRDTGDRSANPILLANCQVGSGFSSGCFFHTGGYSLGPTPLRFPRLINNQFQITRPGLYRLTGGTASVVLADQPEGERSRIPLHSTLDIELIDDPPWSHNQVSETVAAFQRARADFREKGWDRLEPQDVYRNDGLGKDAGREPSILQAYEELRRKIGKAADALRFLDTEESLTEIVRLYDGSETLYGYSNSLYYGIIQSKHQALAAELLEARMVEADFMVSERLLDQLVAMKLRVRFPSAFDGTDSDASLYPAAREILRDYVLTLGKSLAEKDGEALKASAATSRAYATKDFCTPDPLIPSEEAARLLKAAGQPN